MDCRVLRGAQRGVLLETEMIGGNWFTASVFSLRCHVSVP